MPLYKTIHFSEKTTIYIWKITETLEQLLTEVNLNSASQTRVQGMKSELHQRGFLSVRKMLQTAGYTDFDLNYNQTGKPFLTDKKHISISHSHQFATLIISDQEVGIDLEIVSEKVLKIASKFMNMSMLENLSQEQQKIKATVIWGIKETVFKIQNQVGISFLNHIFEDEFNLQDQKAKAQLHFNNQIEHFDIHFQQIDNYALVWGFKK